MFGRKDIYMNSEPAFTADELATLDPSSYVPLYMQLAHNLAQRIRVQGAHAVGKVLPSEAECAQRFGVSRPTVRQAMAHLLSQGLIRRAKGRGTFVAPLRLEHDVSHGFESDMRAAHHDVQYELLAWQTVTAPQRVAALFDDASRGSCYYLRRTRSIDNRIVGLEERYLQDAIGAQLCTEDVKRQPVLALVERKTGLKPARQEIEVSCAIADRAIADVLRVRSGVPLLLRTTTFLAATGQVMMYGTVMFLAENYRFKFSVNYSS